MGGSSAKLAGETARMNQELADRQFRLSEQGLRKGLGFAGSQYAGGGMKQDRKFQALLTDAGEAGVQPLGSVGNIAGVGGRESDLAAARALGFSGVGQSKVLSAVDEINRLRTALSSQGLKTTNLGTDASATSLQALRLLPEHPALSTGLGIAAAGASIYGGMQTPSQGPQTTTIAPIADVQSAYGSAAGLASPTAPSMGDTTGGYFATG